MNMHDRFDTLHYTESQSWLKMTGVLPSQQVLFFFKSDLHVICQMNLIIGSIILLFNLLCVQVFLLERLETSPRHRHGAV